MYPDYEFYLTVFGGREEPDVIMPFIRAGTDIVKGCVICGRDGNEEEFLRACCAQGEYMLENECAGAVKLGEFSFYGEKDRLCPRAAAILEGCGLLYRGID